MKLLFIFFPLFLSAWWSIIFTECNDNEYKSSYKANKELYISNISASVDAIKSYLKTYKNTVINLLGEGKNNCNIFIQEIDNEINKLDSLINNITFNIDFDFVNPIYDNTAKHFKHFSITCPTDRYANISTTAMQEQVLITNKIIIYNLILSYMLQVKNNIKRHYANHNDFDKDFYRKVLEPLLNKIYPIISNFYEEGKEENKNENGEEKSYFDLFEEMITFIDSNEFLKNIYKKKNNKGIVPSNLIWRL